MNAKHALHDKRSVEEKIEKMSHVNPLLIGDCGGRAS